MRNRQLLESYLKKAVAKSSASEITDEIDEFYNDINDDIHYNFRIIIKLRTAFFQIDKASPEEIEQKRKVPIIFYQQFQDIVENNLRIYDVGKFAYGTGTAKESAWTEPVNLPYNDEKRVYKGVIHSRSYPNEKYFAFSMNCDFLPRHALAFINSLFRLRYKSDKLVTDITITECNDRPFMREVSLNNYSFDSLVADSIYRAIYYLSRRGTLIHVTEVLPQKAQLPLLFSVKGHEEYNLSANQELNIDEYDRYELYTMFPIFDIVYGDLKFDGIMNHHYGNLKRDDKEKTVNLVQQWIEQLRKNPGEFKIYNVGKSVKKVMFYTPFYSIDGTECYLNLIFNADNPVYRG